MLRHLMSAALAMTVINGTAAKPLRAQGAGTRIPVPDHLLALARRNLTFGTVLPGIPSSVTINNLDRAALFEIQGPANASIRVELLLPDVLQADLGEVLPITFGSGDGFASPQEHGGIGVVFAPHNPLISTLGTNGRLFLRLGGTVHPGRPQASAAYQATIVLLVYDLGS